MSGTLDAAVDAIIAAHNDGCDLEEILIALKAGIRTPDGLAAHAQYAIDGINGELDL